MKYPIGIQNFEKLVEGKFTYVDKTKMIYRLVDEGQYYFLSRPRRFGTWRRTGLNIQFSI